MIEKKKFSGDTLIWRIFHVRGKRPKKYNLFGSVLSVHLFWNFILSVFYKVDGMNQSQWICRLQFRLEAYIVPISHGIGCVDWMEKMVSMNE